MKIDWDSNDIMRRNEQRRRDMKRREESCRRKEKSATTMPRWKILRFKRRGEEISV